MITLLEKDFDLNRIGDTHIVLTHGDADGVVSALNIREYIRMTFSQDNYIILASLKAQPEETDKMLERACKLIHLSKDKLSSKHTIWILDRPSFTKEFANTIPKSTEYMVFDHHESSVEHHNEIAKRFTFNSVYTECDIDHCGATLTSEFLLSQHENIHDFYDNNDFNKMLNLKTLSQITNDWDTFRWKTLNDINRRLNAFYIQSCDKILGISITWEHLTNIIDNTNFESATEHELWDRFSSIAKLANDIFENKLNEYKRICDWKAGSNTRTCLLDGKAYRLCFMYGMEEYQSMLSQYIFDQNPVLEAVIWMNYSGTISIRTSDTTDIKANELSKAIGESQGYSGGGHPKAAGGRIVDSKHIRQDLYKKVQEGLLHFGFNYVPNLPLED